MTRHKAIARFVLFAAAFAAQAQTLPSGVSKITSVEGITEYSLPNGLRVLLFPDPSHPKVTVNITYLVGSRHEGYGETGMAHLLEHVMFIQTKTRPDIKKELKDHGAVMNGSTSWDRTNYFETMTATDENLKYGIELEADRMVNCKFDKGLLDKEMTVVRNEFEMNENSPDGILVQRVLEAGYSWHNYGKLTIGNRSDIENVPLSKLELFYGKYYQPDDALLTVAGKFDETKAMNLIVAAFSKIPKPARVLEQTYTTEPTQDGERSVTLRRVGDTQSVVAMYHVPSGSHPDAAAVDVLAGVLGDTPSGRLYKAMVDNKKSVSANMEYASLHDPGFILAVARVKTDQNLEDAKQTLLKTIEGLVTEAPSKEEVDRVKTRLLKEMEMELADSQSVANDLGEYASQGDWRLMFLMRDRIKTVTEADVLRVAKAYLKESNRTLGTFIPTKNPDRAEVPPTPDIAAAFKDFKGSEAMSQGETFEPTSPNIQSRLVRANLPSGVKVSVLPKKTRGGTVVAQVTIRFGDEKAVFGKSAVASIAGSLLMRGTRNKSRQQIQDEMDKLKAQIGVSGGATNANATVETVEANLPAALKLAAEILREPAFAENEFETVRQQRIAAAEAGRSEPSALAGIELQRRLNSYPRGDPRYASTADELIEDLKKVTIEDVRKFHRDFYGASVAELSVSGQTSAAEVQKLAADLFSGWKSPGSYARVTSPYRKAAAADKKIETPDKQNAFFMVGTNIKMTDTDPDYPAMMIANYLLGGGGFGSRLLTRIRDKDGLSYGVGSQFTAPTQDDGATFMVQAISAPQNTPKVEAAFREEVARALKDGFTAEEVDAAKKSWAQQRIVGRSDDGAMVGLLGVRARFDRTFDFDKGIEDKVAALTADRVSAVFRKYIDPTQFIYVKAGDFKKAGVL